MKFNQMNKYNVLLYAFLNNLQSLVGSWSKISQVGVVLLGKMCTHDLNISKILAAALGQMVKFSHVI